MLPMKEAHLKENLILKLIQFLSAPDTTRRVFLDRILEIMVKN